LGSTSLSMQGDCRGLSDKRRVFVAAYTIHYDATKAAREAKYKNPAIIGARLLKDPRVARAIGRIQQRNMKQCVLTREDILQELSSFAKANIIELFDPDSHTFRVRDIRKLRELPESLQRCIQTFKAKYRTNEYGKEVVDYIDCKLVDKLGSIKALMEHFGMFAPQQHEIKHSVDWDSMFEGSDTVDDLAVIEGEITEASEK